MPEGEGTPDVEVTILVEEAARAPERFDELVQRLSQTGLKVEQRLRQTGVVTGFADPQAISRLGTLEGVEFVEPARSVSIPEADEPNH